MKQLISSVDQYKFTLYSTFVIEVYNWPATWGWVNRNYPFCFQPSLMVKEHEGLSWMSVATRQWKGIKFIACTVTRSQKKATEIYTSRL